ncbi:MAG: cellulase family glycosylhydrolase, partial [Pseudomonadota bacterium]
MSDRRTALLDPIAAARFRLRALTAIWAAILALLAAFSVAPQSQAATTLHDPSLEPLPGVNLPSGSFGSEGDELGRDYIYPSNEDIDRYAAKGFHVIRLSFLARRLLAPDGRGGFNPTSELSILTGLIDHAATKDMSVILDMHDYGKNISGELIGTSTGSVDEFAASWKPIA